MHVSVYGLRMGSSPERNRLGQGKAHILTFAHGSESLLAEQRRGGRHVCCSWLQAEDE
jgi:hypothetical protein